MDQVPLEIISAIVEQLEQLTISDDAFSHSTETFKDGPVSWLSHTVESRQDVRKFRLVCRKFYNGSFKSFGKILGDRKFRITKVGLQDLKGIAKVKGLVPYIQILTFGNARFIDIDSWHGSQSPKVVLAHVPDSKDRTRLCSALKEASQWASYENTDRHVELLTSALKAFANLKSIRLVDSDRVDHDNHLAGWMEQPGDDELVRAAWLRCTEYNSIYHTIYGGE